VRVRYEELGAESTKTLEPYGLVLKGGKLVPDRGIGTEGRANEHVRVDHIREIETLEKRSLVRRLRPRQVLDGECQTFRERVRTETAVLKLSINAWLGIGSDE